MIIAAIFWAACGLAAAGAWVAWRRAMSPLNPGRYYRADLLFGISAGLFLGPIFLCAVTLLSGVFDAGWTLLPPKKSGLRVNQ